MTICCTRRSVSREIIVAAEQLRSLPERRFQAHSSTFEKLSVELQGCVIPEPWPIPHLRTLLEMEASLLDSDVQELLGREEFAGYELTSNPQLQWATQTEFPSVVRLFGVNCCCASSLPSSAVEEHPSAMLGIPAASRKSSSPALHEARTLLGAGAGISRIRLLVKPICAVPSKNRCASPPTPRTCRNTCKVGYSSGQAQNLTLIGGRVRSGYVACQ